MADSDRDDNLPARIFDFEGKRVRVVKIGGEPIFVAVDVATALGYANPRGAIADHCKNTKTLKEALESKGERFAPPTGGGDLQEHTTVMPLSDVLRLFVKSRLPAAERFEKQVFEEILPTIYMTGSYTEPGATPNIEGTDIPTLLEAAAKELRDREAEADKMIDAITDERKRRKALAIESSKKVAENRRLKEALGKMEKEVNSLSGHAFKFKNQMAAFMKAMREGKLNINEDLLDENPEDQDDNVTPIRPKKL